MSVIIAPSRIDAVAPLDIVADVLAAHRALVDAEIERVGLGEDTDLPMIVAATGIPVLRRELGSASCRRKRCSSSPARITGCCAAAIRCRCLLDRAASASASLVSAGGERAAPGTISASTMSRGISR